MINYNAEGSVSLAVIIATSESSVNLTRVSEEFYSIQYVSGTLYIYLDSDYNNSRDGTRELIACCVYMYMQTTNILEPWQLIRVKNLFGF